MPGILDTVKDANPATKYIGISNISDLFTKGGFNIISFIFYLTGLIFLGNLILAAWEYLASWGDAKKISAATSHLLNAFFGIVIVLASFVLVTIFTSILGITSPLGK